MSLLTEFKYGSVISQHDVASNYLFCEHIYGVLITVPFKFILNSVSARRSFRKCSFASQLIRLRLSNGVQTKFVGFVTECLVDFLLLFSFWRLGRLVHHRRQRQRQRERTQYPSSKLISPADSHQSLSLRNALWICESSSFFSSSLRTITYLF